MKTTMLIASVTALMLLSGCNEEKKPETSQKPVIEIAPKEDSQKPAVAAVEQKPGAEVPAPVKLPEVPPVAKAAQAVVKQVTGGASLYAKCGACHGPNGKKSALNKSAIIAGQTQAELVASLTAYKNGTRNVAGMGALMKGQVSAYSNAEIEALAKYISNL